MLNRLDEKVENFHRELETERESYTVVLQLKCQYLKLRIQQMGLKVHQTEQEKKRSEENNGLRNQKKK